MRKGTGAQPIARSSETQSRASWQTRIMEKLSMPVPSLLRPLPKLASRHKLHICFGTPYGKALADMYTGYDSGDYWTVHDRMRVGDLVLSMVATVPRMIIGLDVVEVDYDPRTSKYMECDQSVAVRFEKGILADAVANPRNKVELPESGYLEGSDARGLLKALDAEYQLDIPWFTPDRWHALR